MTWQEKVIGSNRLADPDHGRAGTYGFFEKRVKRDDRTVIARVYPDFGTTDADGPHLWGVVFPKGATGPERRFGAKAKTRKLAQRDADDCIRRGGWDGIERNDNGTIPMTYDDVPEEELT